jgi:2-iminobutanoate/2-iminopropanoate deaminase
MPKFRVVRTSSAPGAIGPYSQAIAAGGFLFVSGQIPLDPGTGRPVDGGIAEQVGRVLENLKAVLQAGGAGMETVVKTTVYLTDLSEFPGMNEVYARYFGSDPPARTTVQVSALPKGVKVEIDAIAAP